MNRRRPGFFYGWIIVGIVFFCTVQIYGIRHSFSVFFPYILKEFDWLRGSTAFMYSMNVGIYGVLASIAGTLGDRWKPKKVLLIGIILLALATASCAFALELWHFYVLFGLLVPLGTAFCGWPILVSTLVNWFYRRRGLAIALANAGVGLSFTYGIFAELVISQVGWRWAYVVLSGIMAATILPLYLFLFHHRPEEVGLTAYGLGLSIGSGEPKKQNGPLKGPGLFPSTFKRTIGSYRLWFLVLSDFFFWGIGGYLVLPHQIKLAGDAGYSTLFAASIFAFFGIFMVAGQFSSAISDWIGREATVTIACLVAIIGLIALIFVNDTSRPWLLYLYAISFGYGCGLYSPAIFAGAADIFLGKHYGLVAGLILMGMGTGGVIGPWLGGYLYDISGDYRAALILAMVSLCLAWATFLIAAPRKGVKS